MFDLADRMLATLGAVLLVLVNELHLFNVRPRAPDASFVHEMLMRGAGASETVYLSTPDLWLRAALIALAACVALWAVTASVRDVAKG